MSTEGILQQIGLDYVVKIPRELVQSLDLKPGAVLDIRAEQQCLMIAPVNTELAEVQEIHQELMENYQAAFKKLAE
ncbi:AbrB/MazE/SpoVT family DNA-binding domain-containing protein [Thiorhodovibrio frisius]|uniref:Addiction module antidote n=1 Tax=Thiorhodovibrio frisius TaxID=631362 RepID=H8Z1A5_9GAMM|nr:hypothetical protein [Thiorhodovibrio frisius]EIC21420.1 hypothetical protein Thi970DRAFT_01628 [Thiorhodovibrio frisius]WPL24006.1 putative addiction module antidote [Thiorhodovibrio frisius]